jgi:ankyrin repeat protein
MADAGETVDLNTANAKQKTKIYRAVTKEIKSKEIEIKLGALSKFQKDVRYFVEGNAFTPFMEALVVKKKSIDFSKTALEWLNTFLEGHIDDGVTLVALNSVYNREAGGAGGECMYDLVPMNSLVEAITYKEELKKQKPVKSPVKGQPPTIPDDLPERDIVQNVRTLALQALHSICLIIANPNTNAADASKEHLCKSFANIPSLVRSILWVLNSVVTRYMRATQAPADSVGLASSHLPTLTEKQINLDCILREGCWALVTAVTMFRYSDASVVQALNEGQLIQTINMLSAEKCFIPYISQIYEILAKHSYHVGIKALTMTQVLPAWYPTSLCCVNNPAPEPDFKTCPRAQSSMSCVVAALEQCSEALVSANQAQIAAASANPKDAKGGAAKAAPAPAKDAKGKGAATAAAGAANTDMSAQIPKFVQEDPTRQLCTAVRALSVTLSLVAQHTYLKYPIDVDETASFEPSTDAQLFTEDMTRTVGSAVSKAMSNSLMWSTCKSLPSNGALLLHYRIIDTLACLSMCVADISLLRNDNSTERKPSYRSILCDTGIVNALLFACLQSASTVGDSTISDSVALTREQRLCDLRRIFERTTLMLMTERRCNLVAVDDPCGGDNQAQTVNNNQEYDFSYVCRSPVMRWLSCVDYVTDTSLFPLASVQTTSQPDAAAPTPKSKDAKAGKDKDKEANKDVIDASNYGDKGPMAILLAMITASPSSSTPSDANPDQTEAQNLSNVGSRILSSLLQSCQTAPSRTEFVQRTGLKDPVVVNKLARILQNRLISLIEDARILKDRALVEVGGTESEPEQPRPSSQTDISNIQKDIWKMQSAPPTPASTVYHLLTLFETLLSAGGPEGINAFASGASSMKEFIVLCAQCLYICGPVSCALRDYGNYGNTLPSLLSMMPTNTQIPSQDSGNNCGEYECLLFDMRRYFWTDTGLLGSTQPHTEPAPISNLVPTGCNSVLLRPLLFDILCIVARAHRQYLTFEGNASVPVSLQSLAPLPASVSPCREASLSVCKYVVDVCVSVLSIHNQFTVSPSPTLTPVGGAVVSVPNKRAILANILHVDTHTSALSLLTHMSCNGADGVYAMLDGVAEAGFGAAKHSHSAIVGLQSFLLDTLAPMTRGNLESESVPLSKSTDAITSSMNELRIDGYSPVKQRSPTSTGVDIDAMEDSQAVQLAINAVLEDFTWTRGQYFDQVWPGLNDVDPSKKNNKLLTSLLQLPSQKQLWPYLCICAALSATIGSPSTTNSASETSDGHGPLNPGQELEVATKRTTLATTCIRNLVSAFTHDIRAQPVCCDVFTCVFLAIGACVGLLGSVSTFGKYNKYVRAAVEDASAAAEKAANYTRKHLHLVASIVNRGRIREGYWRGEIEKQAQAAAALLAQAEIDPKTGKPRPNNNKDKDKEKEKLAKEKEKAAKEKAAAAAKGKGGAATTAPSCVSEVMYNDEIAFMTLDEQSPDPNRGPTAALFKDCLLQVQVDEYHSNCPHSSILTCAVQTLLDYSLPAATDVGGNELSPSIEMLVADIIASGANVNAKDGAGMSSLMYAICLHANRLVDDSSAGTIIHALLSNGADVDMVDGLGNPVLKYLCISLSEQDISDYLAQRGHVAVFMCGDGGGGVQSLERRTYNLLGYPSEYLVAHVLANTSIDVNVCDADGNGPLHWFLGLGRLRIVVGGHVLNLQNAAFNSLSLKKKLCPNITADDDCANDAEVRTALAIVTHLLRRDVNSDACNKVGQTALHLAAGWGCETLIDLLLDGPQNGVTRNCVDALGFLPIHYTASAAPSNAALIIGKLLTRSQHQPCVRMVSDAETDVPTRQLSAAEKLAREGDLLINRILQEALTPACVVMKRANKVELLLSKIDAGTNILQLAMCGHSLITAVGMTNSPVYGNVAPFVRANEDNKFDRISLCSYLVQELTQDAQALQQQLLQLQSFTCNPNSYLLEVMSNVDSNNMSILHAAAKLFCHSNTVPEMQTLNAAQMRSKRVKSYASTELQILDLIFTMFPKMDVNAVCCLPVRHNINYSYSPDLSYLNKTPTEAATEAQSQIQAGIIAAATGPWTPLLAAMHNNNLQLTQELIAHGARTDDDKQFLHSLATNGYLSREMADFVVHQICSCSVDYHTFLNTCVSSGSSRPIAVAVRAQNINLVRALTAAHKCELNVVDEVTGQTPFFEACAVVAAASSNRGENMDVVTAFAENASDKLDFLIKCAFSAPATGGDDKNGTASDVAGYTADGKYPITVVELVLAAQHEPLLQLLINMRRNDVVEIVVSASNNSNAFTNDPGSSILETLERANITLAQKCGCYAKSDMEPSESNGKTAEVLDAYVNGNLALSMNDIKLDRTVASLSSESPDKEGQVQTYAFGNSATVMAAGAYYSDSDLDGSNHGAPFMDTGPAKTPFVPFATVSEQVSEVPQRKRIVPTMAELQALERSNRILSCLLGAVNGAGFSAEENHVHACFAKGMTYSEYCAVGME